MTAGVSLDLPVVFSKAEDLVIVLMEERGAGCGVFLDDTIDLNVVVCVCHVNITSKDSCCLDLFTPPLILFGSRSAASAACGDSQAKVNRYVG